MKMTEITKKLSLFPPRLELGTFSVLDWRDDQLHHGNRLLEPSIEAEFKYFPCNSFAAYFTQAAGKGLNLLAMAGVWKWSSGNEAVDEAPVLESAGDLQLQSPLLRRQRLIDSVLVWHKVAAVSGLSRAFVLEMALGLSAVTEILLSCFLPSGLFVLNSLMIVLIFQRDHSLSCLFVVFRACSFLGFHKWWNSRSFVYFLCIARRHLIV